MLSLNLDLFRRTSAVQLVRSILVAMAMILVAPSDPSLAQTTVEPGYKFIAAGSSHSLAVTCDGHVYAWGGNTSWQCGLGDDDKCDYPVNRTYDVPILVDGLPASAVEVVGGGFHSMALMSNGQVYAWGANSDGQLGIDSHDDYSCTPVAVQWPYLYDFDYFVPWPPTPIKKLAAGQYHSLAVEEDGGLWAWGENGRGQLGIGSNDNHSVPYAVHGPGGEG